MRWVGIEHRPLLPSSGANDPAASLQLANEVKDVRNRAPEVGVQMPSTWCNSRRALLLQNAVEVDHPEAAPALRRRLFQAYWLNGQILSSDGVLGPERERFADVVPEDEVESLERLTRWWSVHVDRIPAMIAPTGHAHLGLQNRSVVARFVNSALGDAPIGPGCQ